MAVRMRLPSLLFRRPARLAGMVGLALVAREVLARAREEEIRNEVALVTGGSRGLGLLVARELAREGCRVVICARDGGELERARGILEEEGAEVLAVTCDVGSSDDVGRMLATITERFGQVDILVNNAGIIQVGALMEMTLADFEEAQRVILWGTVQPTLAVLPAMIARGYGRIVNVTSIGGRVSVPHLLPYGTAKFGAVGFSEGLRAELGMRGISVTTIVPGLMRTGSYLNAMFKDPDEPEFTWFGLGAALPVISMDAARAARQIVTAMRRGEAERTLGLPAVLLARFHGLAPGLTADLLGIVARLLPDSGRRPAEMLRGPERPATRGEDVEARLDSAPLELATTLGRSAAERLNERKAPAHPGEPTEGRSP
jgi:NAD(P)-dependent dehydrogenase (short-subunit alcohol dehydrogenase family)